MVDKVNDESISSETQGGGGRGSEKSKRPLFPSFLNFLLPV